MVTATHDVDARRTAAGVEREDAWIPRPQGRIAAWVYRGVGSGARPAVVLGHGFAGTRDAGLEPYAERFAAAGITAIVFDYLGFGDSEGAAGRQDVSVARQRDDWRAVVAWTRALAGVDSDRVALWGSSFSGGHVVEIAAKDPRVAAVVAQVPFADGLAVLGTNSPRQAASLTMAAVRDIVAGRRGGRVDIPAAGAPGSLAAMTTPDALAGYESLVPASSRWENRVRAGIVLGVLAWRPVRRASQITCPILVCIAEDDAVTPPAPAALVAARAPRGELRRYPGAGHFEIYAGPVFDAMVTDEVAFLRRHLHP